MITKITPKQAKQIHKLVRSLCCNCDHDNCLLLDNGDDHKCVQLISQYGIYCNYFKNAVLPADKELHAEIMNKNSGKICTACGSRFYSKAKNKRYCDSCAEKIKRQKAVERKRKPTNKKSSPKKELDEKIL